MRRPLRSMFETWERYGREWLWAPAAVKDLFLEWNGCRGWNKSLKADAIALPPTAIPSSSYNCTNHLNTQLKRTANEHFLLAEGDFLTGAGAGGEEGRRKGEEGMRSPLPATLAMFFIVKGLGRPHNLTLTMKNIVKTPFNRHERPFVPI
ncbi:hypothetical protein [Paenibacillus eucommiae]|uniref:Uncharacterized protein n=1 Tax=Paenibacillus eucommiae TaxID=1355755 RepID=A0ABS4J9W4_9BACL|nr:hypothetical protein [Paenibacillus eucommiae]MBP1996634.1 hypothetical protein [Paenibacillus eucommiae]